MSLCMCKYHEYRIVRSFDEALRIIRDTKLPFERNGFVCSEMKLAPIGYGLRWRWPFFCTLYRIDYEFELHQPDLRTRLDMEWTADPVGEIQPGQIVHSYGRKTS